MGLRFFNSNDFSQNFVIFYTKILMCFVLPFYITVSKFQERIYAIKSYMNYHFHKNSFKKSFGPFICYLAIN